MLPGVGLQEMLLIAIVAITVVGPKDLPLLMRKFGRWVSKMRAMAHDFQSSFEDLARQAELDELRKEVEALKRDTTRDLTNLKHAAHIDDPFAEASAPVDTQTGELPLEPAASSPVEHVVNPNADTLDQERLLEAEANPVYPRESVVAPVSTGRS